MTKYVFFGLIALILFNQIEHTQVKNLLFVACGLIAYFFNRYEPNISSLLVVLVVMRAAEILAWEHLNMRDAYVGYPVLIAVDSIALFLITNRNKILAKVEYKRTGQVTPYKYLYTNADYTLAMIYKIYLAITLLMFGEHLLRHLDDLGLPEEWNFSDLLYVYNSSSFLKRALNIFEYVAILATAHRIMHSERYVHA